MSSYSSCARPVVEPDHPMPSMQVGAENTLGQLGDYYVRLAQNDAEIRQSQALRYHVFFEEMGASTEALCANNKLDVDPYDAFCDHLLVFDRSQKLDTHNHAVIASYRLLDRQPAARAGGYYSQSEFRVDQLLLRHPELNFLEFGRSCVHPNYRSKRTIELLWHGAWSYILKSKADILFGCASFPTTNIQSISNQLAFLYHYAGVEHPYELEAQPGRGIDMNLVEKSSIQVKKCLSLLPPLIKGYLRLGAKFARQAVVDDGFGTTDVMIILPVGALNPRYIDHYGAGAERLSKQSA